METRRLLLWLTGSDIGNMSSAKGIINTVLLPLQLFLGLWQIAKLTPLWALMRCTVSWLMMILFPYFSCCCSDYILLKQSKGRVFKKVTCYVTTPVHEVAKKKGDGNSENVVQVKYLGKVFNLERKPEEKSENHVHMHGDRLFWNDVPKYYVTDEVWQSILCLKEVLADKKEVGDKEDKAGKKEIEVFIKNHKEIWEEVVTGRVMSLEELLDSVILDNHTVSRLDHEYFLPIDLMLSEEKILKVLNLVGLFLQKQKHIHWLIPSLLSLTSAVMGLCSTLRRRLYGGIYTLFRCAIHLVCNQLDDFWWRRQAYSLGNWIDNLKPSNDLQSKILRGDITALIAGGARVENDIHCATLLDVEGAQMLDIHQATLSDSEFKFNQGQNQVKRRFECGTFDIDCEFPTENDSIEGGAEYMGKCKLKAGEIATVAVDCNSEEAQKLFKFAYHMADTKSGSLKSYDPGTKTVHVRRFRESVIAYVRSGYPPLCELKLDNVVVR